METFNSAVDAVLWPGEDCFLHIVDELVRQRWVVVDDFLPPQLVEALRAEIAGGDCPSLKPAGIGRGDEHQLASDIRLDRIRWLNNGSEQQRVYQALMEQLRAVLNRSLFLGLFEYEAHFSLYEPGAFYRKHVDAFKGRGNRRVTTVCYLNTPWQATEGGDLVLYDSENTARVLERILPQPGRLVVFMSEDFPHEVLPATRHRYSIAGWYRINTSIGGVVDPPR